MKAKTITIIFMFLVTLAIAYAVPLNPHAFYGTVTIGGTAAPAGSTISVSTDSIVVSPAGVYGSNLALGDKLTYSGSTAGETITFTMSGATGCSLTTGTTTTTYSPGTIEERALAFEGTCVTVSGGTPGGGGGAGAGGAGAGAAPVTQTQVTDSATIAAVSQSLPSTWTNVNVYQYGDPTSESMDTTADTVSTSLAYASETKAISELQQMKEDIRSGEVTAVPTTTTMQIYHVENKDTGEWTYTTQMTVTATATQDMENVVVIEVIPANVASIDEIVFIGQQPELLQTTNGVIAKWTIASLQEGDSVVFQYFIKKKLASISTMTLAAGEGVAVEPTAPAEEEKPPAKAVPWTGIIIVAAIVVLGVVIYLILAKRKKK